MDNIAWYYEVDGACIGPVTQDALCHLLRTAAIGPTTRVRCDALPHWLLAAQVPGLQAVASPPPLAGAAAQPPPLPAGTHLVQPDPIVPTVLQGVVNQQPGQAPLALAAAAPTPAGLPGAPVGGAAAAAVQPNYLVWENPAAQAAAAATAGVAPQEAEPGESVMLAVRPASPNFETSSSSSTRRVNEENVPQVRPWVRFWARGIDAMVAGFAFAICCLGWAALAGPMGKWTFLLSAGFFLMWIFVEAFMLSEMGTTIGKAVLGITVRNEQGEDLTYGQALARGFRVLYRGMGLGVPFVNLVAMIVSYFRLTGNGSTTWDRDGRLTVSHSRIGVGRGVAAFVCIVALYGMTVFASAIAASATDPGGPVVAAAALPTIPVTNIPSITISGPQPPVPTPPPAPPQPTPAPPSIRAVSPNPDRRVTVKRKAAPSGKAPAGAKAPAAAAKGTSGAKAPAAAGSAAQPPARSPASAGAGTSAAAATRARRVERTQTASAATTDSGQETNSNDGRIIIIRRTR